MTKKVFVLAGDYGYIRPVTTCIKSILYHNADSTIYVINKDIPQEWFSNVNNHVRCLHSSVINLRLAPEALNDEHVSQPQINEMSYGRLLIPQLVDEPRALYLDSDTVVNADLSPLFKMNLGDHPVAAVTDLINPTQFNSGVILFNLPVLNRDSSLVDRMLKAGLSGDLKQGDQTVLNQFFADSYLHLPLKYNLTIGYDFICDYHPEYNHDHYFAQINSVGATNASITHFTGVVKPWEELSWGRDREMWWQYADLEWPEVVNHHTLPSVIDYSEDKRTFTLTNSEHLKEIETLIKALPQTTFNIGARTVLGGGLTKLLRYPNVHLYRSIVSVLVDSMIATADIYLDINLRDKDTTTIRRFQQTGKPIFAFKGTGTKELQDADNYRCFDSVSEMIAAIKKVSGHGID